MFPKDFLFGASMSGFQVEMGYAKGDLDPNTDWFVWVREPENLINSVVSGHLPEYGVGYWYNFPTIHKLASDFGMNVLRTNIEWSRIFPRPTYDVDVKVEQTESDITSVQIDERALRELDELADKDAVEHYREIFSDMRKKGLKVFVNLVHFTLPIWLHDPIAVHKRQETDKLGWASKRSIVEFAKFAAYVVWKFDDLVDMYSTFNEPNIVSQMGYVMSVSGFPPAVFDTEKFFATFVNQIVAHARAYDVMKTLTNKPVGLIYAASIYESTNSDAELEESVGQFMNFAFLDAINSGVLLFQTREDLAGRLDFLGLNYYTRTVIQRSAQELSFGLVNMNWSIVPGYGYSCQPGGFSRDGRPVSDFGWETYPEGLLKLLRMMNERYALPIYVTENGVADARDWLRPYHLVAHMYAVERAVEEGLNVKGYLHWSIVDNYEWAKGYHMRFGLAETNYQTKSYNPRPSMYIFREIVKEMSTEKFRNYLFSPYQIWRQ
uniref:Glycoside hydrolase family 1 protein n=1 Tax=Pseudothermotoga hypogea TaxID=57487 RepID=A0A832I5W4_9THEM